MPEVGLNKDPGQSEVEQITTEGWDFMKWMTVVTLSIKGVEKKFEDLEEKVEREGWSSEVQSRFSFWKTYSLVSARADVEQRRGVWYFLKESEVKEQMSVQVAALERRVEKLEKSLRQIEEQYGRVDDGDDLLSLLVACGEGLRRKVTEWCCKVF